MNNVRKIRGEYNMTQEEMANEICVSRVTINKIENGGLLSYKTAKVISNRFNHSLAYVFGMDNFKPNIINNDEDKLMLLSFLVKTITKTNENKEKINQIIEGEKWDLEKK